MLKIQVIYESFKYAFYSLGIWQMHCYLEIRDKLITDTVIVPDQNKRETPFTHIHGLYFFKQIKTVVIQTELKILGFEKYPKYYQTTLLSGQSLICYV